MSRNDDNASMLESLKRMHIGVDWEHLADAKYSDEYRKKGNKLFGEAKYFGAIAQYNKALVCARNDPERAALCYGNRSAVYLEMEYFKHCLHNIDLAEPNFPADKTRSRG